MPASGTDRGSGENGRKGATVAMEHAWIAITIAGALLQAVRTAGQKSLNAHLSVMTVTYVRSLYGLPFLAGLLLLVLWQQGRLAGGTLPAVPAAIDTYYLWYCFIGAMAQILATALLVYLFTLRNFAVATVLPKSELVIVALLGLAFFSERITPGGWLGIGLALAGVLMVSLGKMPAEKGGLGATLKALLDVKAAGIGLASGTLFAITALHLREASLHLGPGGALYRGAWTALVVVAMQTAVLTLWLLWREREQLARLARHLGPCLFIGLTSALGSFCWLVAFGMANASYVRAVGQVEIAFTLLMSWLWFRERVQAREIAGIAVIVAGVLVFRLFA
jgi:drug/metabolite transporter (DMT)-like permease